MVVAVYVWILFKKMNEVQVHWFQWGYILAGITPQLQLDLPLGPQTTNCATLLVIVFFLCTARLV